MKHDLDAIVQNLGNTSLKTQTVHLTKTGCQSNARAIGQRRM